MKRIYLNNASTTKIDSNVKRLIIRELAAFDNPSDISKQGCRNYDKINKAKNDIAQCLMCSPKEIYFTASGSEGDNTCLKMLALKQKELTGRNHIITSSIEHKAVLNSCRALSKIGFDITYIQPNSQGVIVAEDIKKAITSRTCLVSIMAVNNILGTIQPINLISQICHQYNIIFHTDMVQALGHIPIDLTNQNIDAATFSGHKIHGPKIGFMYIKSDIPFDAFINGGGQEYGKRAGTENVAYIVGVAQAVKNAVNKINDTNTQHLNQMRRWLIYQLTTIFQDNILFNGSDLYHIPNTLSFCLKNISGESIVYDLSHKYNICVSEGSACNTGDMMPDYVLQAINVPDDFINGAIRVSLDVHNTLHDCAKFIYALTKVTNYKK